MGRRVWVEGFSFRCGLAWALAGERVCEMVDVVWLNGGERDLRFCFCHRVHLTPLHPNFRTPSPGDLTIPPLDRVY